MSEYKEFYLDHNFEWFNSRKDLEEHGFLGVAKNRQGYHVIDYRAYQILMEQHTELLRELKQLIPGPLDVVE